MTSVHNLTEESAQYPMGTGAKKLGLASAKVVGGEIRHRLTNEPDFASRIFIRRVYSFRMLQPIMITQAVKAIPKIDRTRANEIESGTSIQRSLAILDVLQGRVRQRRPRKVSDDWKVGCSEYAGAQYHGTQGHRQTLSQRFIVALIYAGLLTKPFMQIVSKNNL